MDALVTTHRFRRVVVVRCQGELDLSVKTEFALALSAIAARPADARSAGTQPPDARSTGTQPADARSGGTRPAPIAEPDGRPSPVAQAVVVDLADVTFLDCAALGVLVGLADRCVHTDRHFLLAGPQAIVRRMLAALRLDRVFVVTPTVAEAIALAESWAELDGPPSAPPDPRTRAWAAAELPVPTEPVPPAARTASGFTGTPGDGLIAGTGLSGAPSRRPWGVPPVIRQSPRPQSYPSQYPPQPEDRDPGDRRWMI